MKKYVWQPGITVALVALLPASGGAKTTMRFGVNAKSASKAIAMGMPISYGSMWAGPWNQKFGWKGLEDELRQAKSAGTIPVVQWWYWGDDISPACVQNGCKDRYHGVQKDKATWTRLSNELADLIVRAGGKAGPPIVVVETEFNKNGIEQFEPFDDLLVEQVKIFQRRGLKVVVGFGNWGQVHWKRFDKAIAAADMLGTMSLQSSVRDKATYLSGADHLLEAARYFQKTFGKPTFITDVGFSSYPEASYEGAQAKVVAAIFDRMPELKAAGVEGMVWRMLLDDPKFDTNNYHGQAERHWGLLHADGSPKPAFGAFLTGARAESPAPSSDSAAPHRIQ
jgi:hypothetical protein